MQFARNAASKAPKTTKGKIIKPFVVGAIIDLRLCFSLLDSDALNELKEGHDVLEKASRAADVPMPVNSSGPDRLKRKLDCAVIESMHSLRKKTGLQSYDTVRGAFWEGARCTQVRGSHQKRTCRLQ